MGYTIKKFPAWQDSLSRYHKAVVRAFDMTEDEYNNSSGLSAVCEGRYRASDTAVLSVASGTAPSDQDLIGAETYNWDDWSGHGRQMRFYGNPIRYHSGGGPNGGTNSSVEFQGAVHENSEARRAQTIASDVSWDFDEFCVLAVIKSNPTTTTEFPGVMHWAGGSNDSAITAFYSPGTATPTTGPNFYVSPRNNSGNLEHNLTSRGEHNGRVTEWRCYTINSKLGESSQTYVNSILDGSVDDDITSISSTTNKRSRLGSSSTSMDGHIAEVAVFNRKAKYPRYLHEYVWDQYRLK